MSQASRPLFKGKTRFAPSLSAAGQHLKGNGRDAIES
jgi:hypothetical protein